MAKILYGLSGQGFGHSTRSKETIRHLIDAGHKVKIFTYGQALFMLQKDFSEILYEIPGLTLSYKNNRLVYSKTILDNTKKILKQARHWNKISKEFSDFNPEIIITDFEPLTAILAKMYQRPLISIDNQHQLTNTKIKLDKKYFKDLLADQLIIKSFVWGAKYYLLTSFYKTEPKDKKTFWFAPIIRQEIMNLKPTDGDYILVYEGADFGNTLMQLKHLNYNFVVFNPNKEGQDDNILYKKFSTDEWLTYLAGAKAVIATAGLSLMCEAIYLKKPYLAMPIQKQIEQVINAVYLEKMGFGKNLKTFKITDFKKFMSEIDTYKNNLEQADNCGNTALFKKLDALIKELIKKH